MSFASQIASLIEFRNAKSVAEYLRKLSNQRNQLLYAGPNGYPVTAVLETSFFETRLVRVLALLRAYLLVEPYHEHLPFVQDSLDAFLAMLGALKDHGLHEDV